MSFVSRILRLARGGKLEEEEQNSHGVRIVALPPMPVLRSGLDTRTHQKPAHRLRVYSERGKDVQISGWSKLPTEIVEEIFQYLAEDAITNKHEHVGPEKVTPSSPTPADDDLTLRRCPRPLQGINEPVESREHGCMAAYSAVNEYWNSFFERKIWRSISINQDDIYKLAVYTEPQAWRAGRHLHMTYCRLRINLPKYDCRECDIADTEQQMWTNSREVQDGLEFLFDEMSKWDPQPAPGSLTFELSVYSESDKQHALFKDAYIDSKDPKGSSLRRSRVCEAEAELAPVCKLHPEGLPGYFALFKIFKSTLSPQFTDLARVPAIGKLVLRRQTRRPWDCRSLVSLWQSMPNMETLVYEPWKTLEHRSEENYPCDQDYMKLLGHVPKSVKHVTMYENFDPTLLNMYPFYHIVPSSRRIWESYRTSEKNVAAALALASQPWTTLAASHLVDAPAFLACALTLAQGHGVTWRDLESLSLTSRSILWSLSEPHIRRTIEVAAELVSLAMPRLRTMEIWFATVRCLTKPDPNLFVFRFERKERVVKLTWHDMSTSKIDPFGRSCMRAWTHMASQVDLRLQANTYRQFEPRDMTRCQATNMKMLGLKIPIMHPASMEETEQDFVNWDGLCAELDTSRT